MRAGFAGRDDVRALLAWLERQQLIVVERLSGGTAQPGEMWVATATRAGTEVAKGRSFPGVAALPAV